MTSSQTIEETIAKLLLEYAQNSLPQPVPPELSLRDDLAIESLSLVSVVLRLGEELGVDVVDSGIEVGGLVTVGDLISLARSLVRPKRAEESGFSAAMTER